MISCLRPTQLLRGAGCVLLATILAAPAWAQRGVLASRADLPQLTARAQTIVRGHIVSARVEPHPTLRHLSTVVVTVRVARVLKGAADTNFTFRQFLPDPRDRATQAGYRKGEELLLLLNPPSRYGLTSPVGLDDGRFRIIRNAQGKGIAENGRGNFRLFDQVESVAAQKGLRLSARILVLIRNHEHGPVALDDLEEVITGLVKNP
jgi:hypothetical protein